MLYPLLISAFSFASVYLLVRYGYGPLVAWTQRQELAYDRALRRDLLMDVEPRTVVWATLAAMVLMAVITFLMVQSFILAVLVGAVMLLLPTLVIRHLETKRRQKLEEQLVDGLTTLASGVRAGLNLVQAMELLVRHHAGPIRQEFSQLLREYEMGMDLNQAMRHASNRIGSVMYRLTFTAIELHRVRGGDTGESLDRIAESVREIQRLEGKLDAMTSQARTQANMMAVMPVLFLGMLYMMDPEGVALLFTQASGRLILLIVIVLIVVAFIWIRRIMAVDI